MFSRAFIGTADFDRSRPWAGWQLPGEHAAGNKLCVVCHEEI